MTVDTFNEPTISHEGLCDCLEERGGIKLTPQALCERVNNDGAVRFLEQALAKAPPIKLIQHINRFGDGQQTLEFPLFIGEQQRLPVRLVVYRLPREIYRERQKTVFKSAKRKGRRVRLSYLKCLKYTPMLLLIGGPRKR